MLGGFKVFLWSLRIPKFPDLKILDYNQNNINILIFLIIIKYKMQIFSKNDSLKDDSGTFKFNYCLRTTITLPG